MSKHLKSWKPFRKRMQGWKLAFMAKPKRKIAEAEFIRKLKAALDDMVLSPPLEGV